jgi:hypothetical protein
MSGSLLSNDGDYTTAEPELFSADGPVAPDSHSTSLSSTDVVAPLVAFAAVVAVILAIAYKRLGAETSSYADLNYAGADDSKTSVPPPAPVNDDSTAV